MGRSALLVDIAHNDDQGMPTTPATTISLAMTEQVDLVAVRHAIGRLLWSREMWSARDARRYDELTERELQLMSFDLTRR